MSEGRDALADRIDADLALGRHTALIGELEALVREHPLRERLQAQLMLALYRSGRQADALERYQRARRKLIDELGIEPGQELQDLERLILAQDPALGGTRRPLLRQAGPLRVARLLTLAGVLLVAAAAAGDDQAAGCSRGLDRVGERILGLGGADLRPDLAPTGELSGRREPE